MKNINPMLMSDSYKQSHDQMYPKGMTTLYSNLTPRKSRIKGIDNVVVFGIQAFIKEVLIERFNRDFFQRPLDEVVAEYERIIHNHLGKGVSSQKVIDLHKLGYLPLRIKCLPEGSDCPIKVPMCTIVNTHPDFAWLTNFIETIFSTYVWQPITSATIARQYRKILDKYALETVGNTDFVQWQGHCFAMRGMSSLESAMSSDGGHLLFFTGSDTIPSICWMEEYYNADCTKELISGSVAACYDDKTEILTNSGFKLFEDLSNDDLVAQYEDNGCISFVKPIERQKYAYNGDMIRFYKDGYKYLDVLVTPNHRMVKRTKLGIEFFEAGKKKENYHEIVNFNDSQIIVAGKAVGNLELTDLDRLRIAFQADGSFSSRSEHYTGERTGTIPIRFSLKKERKIRRLTEILNRLGLPFSKNSYEDGYTSFRIPLEERFVKDFSWVKLDKISLKYAQDFIEELSHWDGNKKNENYISYYSSDESCVKMAQSIGILAGYKTHFSSNIDIRGDRLEQFKVGFDKNKTTIIGNNTFKDSVNYSGNVYCVSVPSKMLVVRANRQVLICGNSEHSISCAYQQENEREMFRHLIEDVYPDGIISIVSDSWNLWKVLTEILPSLHDSIMNRNGKITIRPDSGTPEDIICGVEYKDYTYEECSTFEECILCVKEDIIEKVRQETPHGEYGRDEVSSIFLSEGKFYKATVNISWNRHDKQFYYIEEYESSITVEEYTRTPAEIGVVELLWNEFSGVVNEQGYKVLDSHVSAIYGDSITLERTEEICRRLKEKGFASINDVLGIGSYTYQYNTRDTFGMAMKATYCEVNGECRQIFKDPITDTDKVKKSLKGLLTVTKENGKLKVTDQVGWEQEQQGELKTVFEDGKLIVNWTLEEIRQRVKSHA